MGYLLYTLRVKGIDLSVGNINPAAKYIFCMPPES